MHVDVKLDKRRGIQRMDRGPSNLALFVWLSMFTFVRRCQEFGGPFRGFSSVPSGIIAEKPHGGGKGE